MNYHLLFEAVLATMDLVSRLRETRGLPVEALTKYNALRNKIREELIALASSPTPQDNTPHLANAIPGPVEKTDDADTPEPESTE